eukprot:9985040-Prorocentrum_lima.AAC.1
MEREGLLPVWLVGRLDFGGGGAEAGLPDGVPLLHHPQRFSDQGLSSEYLVSGHQEYIDDFALFLHHDDAQDHLHALSVASIAVMQ